MSKIRRVVVLACCTLGIGMLTGCYERVVSARGIGASQYTVQSSNRSNTALDRWYDDLVGNTPTNQDPMARYRPRSEGVQNAR